MGGDGAGEPVLQVVPSSEGLRAVALLLPPAAQPREGLVLHALELGEAQLIEDLVDSGLRRHLERTAEDMGLRSRGGRVPFGSSMPSFSLGFEAHN